MITEEFLCICMHEWHYSDLSNRGTSGLIKVTLQFLNENEFTALIMYSYDLHQSFQILTPNAEI